MFDWPGGWGWSRAGLMWHTTRDGLKIRLVDKDIQICYNQEVRSPGNDATVSVSYQI